VQVEAEGHGQRLVQQRHELLQLGLVLDGIGLALIGGNWSGYFGS
jgi:hypothetical protein